MCLLSLHSGNIAYNKSWSGDHSLYSGAFLKRHSSLWRLTDRGREQAKCAGDWLKANVGAPPIYRFYVSEYIRAMETAGLMDMPFAKWFVEVQLRERDWGTFDIMSQKERVVRFSEETRRRDRDSLFYAP
jgi:NAD+ kinase